MMQQKFGPIELSAGSSGSPSHIESWLPYITAYLEFGSSVIASAVWPAAILTIVIVLKSPIAELLERVRGLNAPGVEVAFDRLQEKTDEAKDTLPSPNVEEGLDDKIGSPPPTLLSDELSALGSRSAPETDVNSDGAAAPIPQEKIPAGQEKSTKVTPTPETESGVMQEHPLPGITHTPTGGIISRRSADPFDLEMARAQSAVFRAIRDLKLLPSEEIPHAPLMALVLLLDGNLGANGKIAEFYRSMLAARRSARRIGKDATVGQLQEFQDAVTTFRRMIDAAARAELADRNFISRRDITPFERAGTRPSQGSLFAGRRVTDTASNDLAPTADE